MPVIFDDAGTSPANFTASVPVLVVGAGACGLIAALTLRDAGIDCVVLERDALPSGSTALSSGFIPACATRWQQAAGVADSPTLMASDIQAKNHHGADPSVVDAVCAASGPTLEWLSDRHGIPFELLQGFLYPGHSVARMHAVPEKTGAALISRLLEAARRADIDLLCDSPVSDLFATRDGRVTGVRVTRADGSSEDIGCDALILACNGFGGDRDMVRRYLPEIADAEYAGHSGNRGDAVRWGEALGARLADMGAYQGHGSFALPHGVLITWALMMEGGIQVNALGRRFWNEHEGYSEAAVHVLAQSGRMAWAVYDSRLHALGLGFPDYVDAQALGAIRQADTLSGLATLTGLPEAALAETFTELGELCRRGEKDQYGRHFLPEQALTPPYFAIKVTGALFHTQGGLEIDAGCRVIQTSGERMPNLFAAGGAARGVSGGQVWGYLSGNGLLAASTLGRLAGQHAADLVRAAAA
jgi:fumarate reductase flavoprotein subunit